MNHTTQVREVEDCWLTLRQAAALVPGRVPGSHSNARVLRRWVEQGLLSTRVLPDGSILVRRAEVLGETRPAAP